MNYLVLNIMFIMLCLFLNLFCMENQVHLRKEILKTSTQNRESVSQIVTSINGKYFLENVSTELEKSEINLWNNSKNRLIKTFDGYNQGQFSPDNNYIIVEYTQAQPSSIPIIPSLYSISFDTFTDLITDQDQKECKSHTYCIDPTGQYIAQELTKIETNSAITEKRLLHYNWEKRHLTPICLNTWGIIWRWAFCNNNESDSESHMIYLNDKKQLIKKSLESSKRMVYSLDENYPELSIGGPIISILYNTYAALLLMKNSELKKIGEIHYDQFNYITNTISTEQGVICYQTDRLSFNIIDHDQILRGSYSLPNYSGWLAGFFVNQSGTHLIALYNSQQLAPSKIVLFDLLHIDPTIKPIHIITDSMYIEDIKFINDTQFMTQGTETKIFNIAGNELACLGKSQASTLHNNEIITLYHTPFKKTVTTLYSQDVPATTTITRYTMN